MSECERVENEEANDEVLNARERIIEMVGKVENLWILEQISQFIHNMTKEG